jgi:hypothetical protein
MSKDNDWQSELGAIDVAPVDALKELKRERDVLDERLKQMDAIKSEVAEPVYIRVRADYETRCRSLEQQADPLRGKAREQYANLTRLLERFKADHEAVTLDRQEIELRHKLGEFDKKEFDSRIKNLEGIISQRAEASAKAQELRQRFLESVHAESELNAATGANFRTLEQPAAVIPEPPAPMAPPPPVPPPVPAGPQKAPSETQVMPALDMAALRTVTGAAPGAGATVVLRSARLVPQTPEAGKNAVLLTLKSLVIGADSVNDVRVGGPGVEPKHAQITVSMAGYTVIDMNTSHGTRVNAEKIRERLLRDQDVIQVGAARWVFREG